MLLVVVICLVIVVFVFVQDVSVLLFIVLLKDQKVVEFSIVIVIVQKCMENLQKVLISIQVLGMEKIEQLYIVNFDDYVKYLFSVLYQSLGLGFFEIYMCGIVSGGDGNYFGLCFSVGVYLDEQLVIIVIGLFDIYMYDIVCVEVLVGLQGLFYGVSVQVGVMCIIINKFDLDGFVVSYSVGINFVVNGGIGYVVEGMVNVLLFKIVVICLVGWYECDVGYVDNVLGICIYLIWGGIVSNVFLCMLSSLLVCMYVVKKNYNNNDINGVCVVLKVDFSDDWLINGIFMGQKIIVNGNMVSDLVVGDLLIIYFYFECIIDCWWQVVMMVQGKIGNFDLIYVYVYFKCDQEEYNDYSDYLFWYDMFVGYGVYIYDNVGVLINFLQYIIGKDYYIMDSYELCLVLLKEDCLWLVVGLFWEKLVYDIEQCYKIDSLVDLFLVFGWLSMLWLIEQVCMDKDEVVFGELFYDFIFDIFIVIVGGCYFCVDNSLGGFYGFSFGYLLSFSYGEVGCILFMLFYGVLCLDFNKNVKEIGLFGKVNLIWNIMFIKLVYVMCLEGYCFGGINCCGLLLLYKLDYFINYELGWKIIWFNNCLLFNGLVFQE